MPNFHKQRVIKRVFKIILTLFIVAVNAILIWRVFFSTSIPSDIEALEPNAPIAAAYLQHGDALQVRYQNNFSTVYKEDEFGYFSNSEALFIPQANQVQVVIRFPKNAVETLAESQARKQGLDADATARLVEEMKAQSETKPLCDWFTFSLVKTTDLTPGNREDNLDESTLSFQRIFPTSIKQSSSTLYTYYRLTFDGVTIEELTARKSKHARKRERSAQITPSVCSWTSTLRVTISPSPPTEPFVSTTVRCLGKHASSRTMKKNPSCPIPSDNIQRH